MRDDNRSTRAIRSSVASKRAPIPPFPAPRCSPIKGPRRRMFPRVLANALVLLACRGVMSAEAYQGLDQPAGPAVPRERVDLYGDRLPPGALARMGTLRFWLGVPISSIAFSPDGKNLAAASAGHGITLRVWDTSAGRTVHILPAPEIALPAGHGVREVTFASNGKTLGAACDDGCIRFWDRPSGRLARVLKAHERFV